MPPQADYIEADPRQAYPWARGFLLLVWPYVPYTPESELSGYYPTSNQSYHAAMGLRQKLLDRGERCEMARVPFKTVMEHWRLGTMLCNSLIALPRWGTRFILQGLMVEAEGECPDPVPSSGCLHCGRCQRACPGGAIDESGYHWRRCIRAYMEEDMPAECGGAASAPDRRGTGSLCAGAAVGRGTEGGFADHWKEHEKGE